MSTQPQTRLTAQEYLEIERKAEFKSEFHNGEMFAVSGGSRAHSRLAVRLAAIFERHLQPRGCDVYNSDLRVLVESDGLYTYPDISIACGEARLGRPTYDVLLNPTLLLDVLSPSTEQYDRGTKVKLYRTIPSLQECLLVSQSKPEIDLYRRETGDDWRILTANSLDSILELTSIDFRLSLRDLYQGILET